MHIKDNLVTQEGTADTQRNNEVHIVLHMVSELLQVLQRAGAVEMTLFDIRKL